MLNGGRGFLVKCRTEGLEIVLAHTQTKESCRRAILELNCLASYNHFRAWCTKTSSRTIRSLQPPRLRRQECHKFTYSMCKAIVQHALCERFSFLYISQPNQRHEWPVLQSCEWYVHLTIFFSSNPQTVQASLIVSKRLAGRTTCNNRER